MPRNASEERIFKALKKLGDVSYESEKLHYTLECEYVPDFIFTTKSGKKLYLEFKGKFDPIARRKMAAVKRQHPDKDIRIIFYNARAKIRKGSNTTNAMWAEKNGYLWADKDVPKKWIK